MSFKTGFNKFVDCFKFKIKTKKKTVSDAKKKTVSDAKKKTLSENAQRRRIGKVRILSPIESSINIDLMDAQQALKIRKFEKFLKKSNVVNIVTEKVRHAELTARWDLHPISILECDKFTKGLNIAGMKQYSNTLAIRCYNRICDYYLMYDVRTHKVSYIGFSTSIWSAWEKVFTDSCDELNGGL
jgi:hypothetical protein